MSVSLYTLEWLNHNSQRAYPLVDWVSRTDTSGEVTLPNSLLVGLSFPVHIGLAVDPSKFHVQRVVVFANGLNIGIGYNDGVEPVASVNIANATHTENQTYVLPGVGDFVGCNGTITVGSLIDVARLPPGDYRFTLASAAIEVDTIRPNIRGIPGVYVTNGSETVGPYYGVINFVAGSNMRIDVNSPSGAPKQLVFNAIAGEGLNDPCDCRDQEPGPPIRYLNNEGPAVDGNFTLVGDSCLTFTPIANGLQVVDECAKPCCGFQELDALDSQIRKLTDGHASLQSYLNLLGVQVTQSSLTMLGSRLADGGCSDCT